MSKLQIPVWIAILININIVIGSAFFMGASDILSSSGLLGPISWLLCGLLLLPLVVVLASLASQYPKAGGLYVYSQQRLGPLWGFVSGWGYYVGAAAANAAVLHAFSERFQEIGFIGNFLSGIGFGGIRLDLFLVALFTVFNLFNIEFLGGAQVLFTVLKSIPLLFVVLSLPFLFSMHNLTTAEMNWTGMLGSFPLVLFAYIGIEACCAVTDKISGGKKNVSKVIFISFGLIMAIYCLLQFALLCIHGQVQTNAFLGILPLLTNNAAFVSWGNTILYIAILSSFLGGFYGMFYYNNWNLNAIAQEKSILFSGPLTLLSKNQAPWVCVFVQSFLIVLFLVLTGDTYYLIAMADFGTVIAYLLSCISFLTLRKTWIGGLSVLSCSTLIFLCSKNLLDAGLVYVIPFIIILVLGLVLHRASDA